MKPAELTAASFRLYPREGREIALDRIGLLRRIPLALLPLLLREIAAYDWKFPAEQSDLHAQFAYLVKLSPEEFASAMEGFKRLRVTEDLERADWVNNPAQFSEQLSAHLWATGQIERFRSAAVEYVSRASAAPEALPVPRIGLVLLGKGAQKPAGYELFRKLRPHGVYFPTVDAAQAYDAFADVVAARAERTPRRYGHWLIDGASAGREPAGAVAVSYAGLRAARGKLQAKIQKAFESGLGSETIRTDLAAMRPEEIGLFDLRGPVMAKFKLSLLTEGSGTQIFSTTFVQWAAREALRRAQPLTLFAHFTPRQREKPMREMLGEAEGMPEMDPWGSLVDADMGAYYTWLNLGRLPGGEKSSFLVCLEDETGRNAQALAIAPGLRNGVAESSRTTLRELLAKLV